MSTRKIISGKTCVKILCNEVGFSPKRQKESHLVLRKDNIVTVVPIHKELKMGTLKGILRLAQIPESEFFKFT